MFKMHTHNCTLKKSILWVEKGCHKIEMDKTYCCFTILNHYYENMYGLIIITVFFCALFVLAAIKFSNSDTR